MSEKCPTSSIVDAISIGESNNGNIQPYTLVHRLGDDHAPDGAAGGAHSWRILQRADFTGARALLIFGELLALYPSDREANAANRFLVSAAE